jgi:predicted enzyme related to lactoylglutathione lyase
MEAAMGHGVRLRIFATDRDRARAFYAHVFGWSLPDDARRHCWVVTTGDDPRLGIDGPHPTGTDYTVNPNRLFVPTIHVPDLDATTAAALANGGDLLVARIPIPGVGWLVYLADTEGNLIGIMQDDPHAAWPRPLSPETPTGTGPPGRRGSGRPGSGASA